MLEDLQYKLKASSTSLALFFFRLVTGLWVGLTLALIGQEIMSYGDFAFIFAIVVLTAAFLKMSKPWQWVGVGVFNLICILIGLLLRMYILVAPGG